MRTPIEITMQMYDARRVVLSLQGKEEFQRHVNEYRPILQAVCDEQQITQMQATIVILKALEGDGLSSLLALAACVEIMEPTQ